MKIMRKKKKQKKIIVDYTTIPSGLAVKTDQATYWIKDGKRYKLISERAANSWCFPTVLATEQAISTMKVIGKLGFRDGTLIKNIADGKMYLISQNKKRHIVSPDSFDRYGLDRSSVVEVSESEADMHLTGENL